MRGENQDQDGLEQTGMTLLAAMSFERLPSTSHPRLDALFLEGALLTALGIALGRFLGAQDAGILSLFLTAAGLVDRLRSLLEHNREAIQIRGLRPFTANRATALGLLALFGGVFAVYATTAFIIGEAESGRSFAFALQPAHLGTASILERRFGAFDAILLHNFGVLVSVTLLSLLYRYYGAALALVWNALVWGVVLSTLVARGLYGQADFLQLTLATVSVLPHLSLEAFAYAAAAVSGVFVSKAMTKYELKDPIVRRILWSSGLMWATALAALIVAAAFEHALDLL